MGDQIRQPVVQGGIQFSPILSEFRFHIGKSHCPVNLFFRLSRNSLLPFEYAVFVDLEILFDGHFADRDIVGLGPGKIVKRRAIAAIGYDPEVHLKIGSQYNS